MAHFAELDMSNTVIRVLTACNYDIANNGGELSLNAAKHFETICPLTPMGVKYVQTSYNNNFRKKFAGIGMKFNENLNMFITPQPYASWTLDSNGDWNAPVAKPITFTKFYANEELDIRDKYDWNESILNWVIRETF